MFTTLDLHRFSGTHREIGQQYGVSCRELILEHLHLVHRRFEAVGIEMTQAESIALAYRPFVQDHAPFLDDEIVGVSEGAGIPLSQAYVLQLRAEVFVDALGETFLESECTTVALQPSATKDARALGAQNADLPAIYRDLMVVVDIAPDSGRRVLMATPAGQVSYIGINDAGLAVFGNFLHCRGWVRGFPRYLLSRVALEHDSVNGAVEAVRALPRASSRNLLMLDAQGGAADFENTPTRDAVLTPVGGVLAHANHYLSMELQGEESSNADFLQNSTLRQRRIESLLSDHKGTVTPTVLAGLLRDRHDAPDAISVEPQDSPPGDEPPEGHYVTVASVIAQPGQGHIWVASGSPSTSRYVRYSFAAGRGDRAEF